MADDDLTAASGPRGRDVGEAEAQAEADADRIGAAAVAAIWVRHRPEILGRVGLVEDAVRDGLAGRADAGRRARAIQAAHQLAGSCGTFGFPVAGEIAGRLEEALAGSPEPSVDAYASLAGWVDALRRALEGGAVDA